jgi:hypothetical protein
MKKFIAALGLAFIGGISSFNAQVCPEEGADNYGEDSLACRQGVSTCYGQKILVIVSNFKLIEQIT